MLSKFVAQSSMEKSSIENLSMTITSVFQSLIVWNVPFSRELIKGKEIMNDGSTNKMCSYTNYILLDIVTAFAISAPVASKSCQSQLGQ